MMAAATAGAGPVHPRIGVAGNTCVDILVRDVDDRGGVDVATAARDGWGDNVQFHEAPIEPVLGGGGVGPALVLAHCGHPVDLNTNLGSDVWGELATRQVRAAGVGLGPPLDAASAANVILLCPDGRRTSHYHAGQKVAWSRSVGAAGTGTEDGGSQWSWFFASGFGLVDDGDLRELQQVFAAMRQRGVSTAFDPSPWFDRCGVDQGAMRSVFAELTCLVGTEEELLAWHSAPTAEALARELLNAGPEHVVVKRGAAGAVWASRAEEADAVAGAPPVAEGKVMTEPVWGTNTTGAGDSFNGYLIHGLATGRGCRAGVEAAVAAATSVARSGRGVQAALTD